MSLKIGDVVLGLIVLVFLVSTFSLFINSAEDSTSLSSGVVGSGISNLNDNLSGVRSSVSQYTVKVDNSSTMSLDDNQQLEDRGTDTGGLANILSKNVLTKFFRALVNEVPSASHIVKYALWFIGILISILLLRFIWGDSKI